MRTDRTTTMRPRRGPGLRLTLLATGLVAAGSGLLLWLAWMLAGAVVSAVPTLPAGTTVRVRGVDVDAVQLGEALARGARSDVLRAGAVAFLLVVAATAVVSWVITGQVLRPLHEVTSTARRLSAESLDERIRLAGPRDEVAELANTFDDLLDRLQAAFESQRRFVANASQELRRMAEVVRQATHRADNLVDGLLTLAHTESTGIAVHQPADLATAAKTAVAAVSAEAAARGIKI